MKPLPKTIEDLAEEAKSIDDTAQKTPRMKLIKAALDSTEIKRSYCSASILMVGSTGVGKSSTVNHLFGLENLAKTNNKASETRSTTEYKLKNNSPEYEVENLVLGLVDSPGINDTEGTQQDACNLYSIKQFYMNHPDYGRYYPDIYPNLIFILVKASDMRIDGATSDLAKSLKGLKKLNLVDEKNPNVVGILTYSCSLPHGNFQKWEEKIKDKKENVEDIIFKYLCVSAPVVVIENEVEEWELEVDGDYSKLPNGELQPKNIYEAGSSLLCKSKDHLGLIILNACFTKISLDKSLEDCVGFEKAATDARKSNLNNDENKLFDYIIRTGRGEGEDQLMNQVETFLKRENPSRSEKTKIREIVGILKTKLQIENENEMKYISQGSITAGQPLSESCRKFIEEMPIGNTSVVIGSNVLGCGYDVRKDITVPAEIFECQTIDSEHGVYIPSIANLYEVNESYETFSSENKNKKEMITARLFQLSIDLPVDPDLFDIGISGGVSGKNSSETDYSSTSLLKEERLFELKMANFDEDRRVVFTKSFKSAVEKLPKKLTKKHKENRRCYEKFFERWGHFVVVSAFCGGSVMVSHKSEKDNSSNEYSTFATVKTKLKALFNVGLDLSYNQPKVTEIKKILKTSYVNWNGGDRDFHNDATLEDPDKMRIWKLSIRKYPTMLQNHMKLEPISTAVGRINKSKEDGVYKAIKHFLGGKFKLITLKEEEAKKAAEAEAKAKKAREESRRRKTTIVDPPAWYNPWPHVVSGVEALGGWMTSLKRKIIG